MSHNCRLLLISIFAVNFCLSETLAQKEEGPVGIFRSQAEYGEFMGSVKRAAYGDGGSVELQAMVPMLNDIALNKPAGWTASEYGAERGTMDLLADADVRSELEMLDDQYKELLDLNSEIQKRTAEQIRQLDFSDRDSLVSKVTSIRKNAIEDLNSVLLPHQIERLQQLRMQTQLRRRSLIDILTADPVKSKLEITDEQSKDLREKEKEVEEELEREIAKLREKAREKLLSPLKTTQKEAVEKMLGESYQFKAKPKRRKSGAKSRGSKAKKNK
jgi:hypothetical protein